MTCLCEYLSSLLHHTSDPRVKDMALMYSPIPTLIICASYMFFCKFLGPRLMKNRKPLKLHKTLILYNFLQMCLNTWIFHEYLQSGWLSHYNFRCQPIDYNENPLPLRMVNTCWWYYVAKMSQMLDTVIFVLRKKVKHATDVHILHHGLMPLNVWVGMKCAPGGHGTLFALVNSFVHVVMYFYNMLSSVGQPLKKFLWWKKYLTYLQILQFFIIMTHQVQLIFTDCNYPKGWMVWIAIHGFLFLSLIINLYHRKYGPDLLRTSGLGACMPVSSYDTESKESIILPDVLPRNSQIESNECSRESIRAPSPRACSSAVTRRKVCGELIAPPPKHQEPTVADAPTKKEEQPQLD